MQNRGLFIGLSTIDIQYFVDSFPTSNKKIKTNPPDIYVGGPATNAAIIFAKLNSSAFLASPIGENAFKSFCTDDFDTNGVTHFDIANNQMTNPVIASVITSKKLGDRNIFTHNPATVKFEITPKKLLEQTNPAIVLLDGFYPEFSLECAKLARGKNIPVVVDGGSWKPQYDDLLSFTDIIICSNDFYPPECKNVNDVVSYIKKKGVRNIGISRGDKNILFHTENSAGEIQITETKAVDTMGAGDFLHGAFCYYYLLNNDFRAALTDASEIATLSCQQKGTRNWLKLLK